MTAWLKILLVLILGGILSTLGDRLGTRVGKARLSIFKLRPKSTAVLITVFTGSIISAISFATMFVFDVKPFDTETDLEALAKALKATTRDGIVCWGQEHKFLPVAFGIKKLRISMIVEDEKVCQDDLEDHMNADGRDDLIQSIDLYTMSKV